MEDDNIDALLVVDAIGFSVMVHRWATHAPLSLREEAEKIYKLREEEELQGLDKLFQYMDRYQKPVIVSSTLTEAMKSSPVFSKLKENGVLVYPTPERAVKVLARLVEYSRYLNYS